MLYKEDDDKLWLDVPATDEPVLMRVTCFHGSVTKVSYYFLGLQVAGCGEEVEVGMANTLAGGKRAYNGAGNNALGGDFKVEHCFTSPGGQEVTYVFPDDYTGEPDFDPADVNPGYRFVVNFRAT